jgi:hypothetical protein
MPDAFQYFAVSFKYNKIRGSKQTNYAYLDACGKYYASDGRHIIFDALLLTFEERYYWPVYRADYLPYS